MDGPHTKLGSDVEIGDSTLAPGGYEKVSHVVRHPVGRRAGSQTGLKMI